MNCLHVLKWQDTYSPNVSCRQPLSSNIHLASAAMHLKSISWRRVSLGLCLFLYNSRSDCVFLILDTSEWLSALSHDSYRTPVCSSPCRNRLDNAASWPKFKIALTTLMSFDSNKHAKYHYVQELRSPAWGRLCSKTQSQGHVVWMVNGGPSSSCGGLSSNCGGPSSSCLFLRLLNKGTVRWKNLLFPPQPK